MSDNRDEAYFADGISEDIITELSRFQELIVVARNSTFMYKDQAVNIQEVGTELNVRYALEGSVRKSGDQVRVTAQLVEAVTAHHLWAERYDRRLEDVFAVQDELTGKIVATLIDKMHDSERRRARSDSDTEDLKAYQLVLRGREHWYRFTKQDNAAAGNCMRKRSHSIPTTDAPTLVSLGRTSRRITNIGPTTRRLLWIRH